MLFGIVGSYRPVSGAAKDTIFVSVFEGLQVFGQVIIQCRAWRGFSFIIEMAADSPRRSSLSAHSPSSHTRKL